MKKFRVFILLLVLLAVLSACGSEGGDPVIRELDSALYTQSDYDAAVEAVQDYFKDFKGCTMTEIAYAGDEKTTREQDYILGFGDYTQGIVLTSTFEVDEHGGDGSLEPNSTYSGWGWYLGRKGDGDWTVVTCGYG